MSGEERYDDGGSTSSAAIRADIEATRARMGDTLEELGSRLNPDRLKQQAKDTVREATIGRVQTMTRNTVDRATSAGRTAVDVVRENPIPVAMIAAGIGWLALRGRSQAVVPEAVADTASEISHGAADRVKAVAGDAKEVASNVASTVATKVSDTASTVASSVSSTVRSQSHRVSTAYDSSPLALGAVVLAAGLAVGMSVPSTRKEGELFGGARDDLVDKAREIAIETKDQIQEVTERVIDEVTASSDMPATLQENRASL